MAEIRKFKKPDWEAYAGAEKFFNGTEPFIYEQEFSDAKGVTVLADRNGIQILLFDDSYEDNIWMKDKELTELRALGEMRVLVSVIKSYNDLADLAYALDNPESELSDRCFQGFKFC